MPKIIKNTIGDGLQVNIQTNKKIMQAQIKQVAVMLNFSIWKDLLNIIYPIFLYRSLTQKVNILNS